MLLRNVTSRTLEPNSGGGYTTILSLDCGHTTRRAGDMLHLQRVCCQTCSAKIGEQTARQLHRAQ